MKSASRNSPSRDSYGRVSPLWLFLMRYGPPRWSEYVVKNWTGQRLVIAVPYLWLLIFFLIPFLIVLKISFAEFSPLGRPPYEPVFRWLRRGRAADQTTGRQLRVPVQRAAVRQRLALFAQGRVLLDRVLPDARLSDGLCHRAFAADPTQRAAAAHHPAVLDLVPAARLCLDRPAEDRRRSSTRWCSSGSASWTSRWR